MSCTCDESGQLKRGNEVNAKFPIHSGQWLHSAFWPLEIEMSRNCTTFSIVQMWNRAIPSPKVFESVFLHCNFLQKQKNYSSQYLLSNWMWLMYDRSASVDFYSIAVEFIGGENNDWHFKDLLHEIVEYLLNFWQCVQRYRNCVNGWPIHVQNGQKHLFGEEKKNGREKWNENSLGLFRNNDQKEALNVCEKKRNDDRWRFLEYLNRKWFYFLYFTKSKQRWRASPAFLCSPHLNQCQNHCHRAYEHQSIYINIHELRTLCHCWCWCCRWGWLMAAVRDPQSHSI